MAQRVTLLGGLFDGRTILIPDGVDDLALPYARHPSLLDIPLDPDSPFPGQTVAYYTRSTTDRAVFIPTGSNLTP